MADDRWAELQERGYRSIAQAARAHGIETSTLAARLRSGKSLDAALCQRHYARPENARARRPGGVTDAQAAELAALGFPTFKAAASQWGLNPQVLLYRLRRGESLSEALTARERTAATPLVVPESPDRARILEDLGARNMSDAARLAGLTPAALFQRLSSNGGDLADALRRPLRKVTVGWRDAMETEARRRGHPSFEDLCAAHGKDVERVRNQMRLRRLSLDTALEAGVKRTRGLGMSRSQCRALLAEEARTGLRVCAACGQAKPRSEHFLPRKNALGGFDRNCNECRSSEHRTYGLERRYDLPAAQEKAMLERQRDACACCRVPFEGRSYVVDHRHADNQVRALLCAWCNWTVGGLEQPDRAPPQAIAAGVEAFLRSPRPLAPRPRGDVVRSPYTATKRGLETRDYTLWNNHCMSPADFAVMFQEQGFVCAVCKTAEHHGQHWCVDHDHVERDSALAGVPSPPTGKNPKRGLELVEAYRRTVRGVLCGPCNRLIGHASGRGNTDAAGLERIWAAVRYLGEHRAGAPGEAVPKQEDPPPPKSIRQQPS